MTSCIEPAQRRQLALITAAAVAIFFGLRALPTGTNLSHMDFRVDPKAGNAIEFCDPLNPQFIPVVAVRSPVSMAIATPSPATAGVPVEGVLTLRTAGGRPVAPVDLLVSHTRKLHLLVVDPTLTDYQHVHPEPARTPGEWRFAFTPQRAGTYRIFGDFTPAATGRGLYASVDLDVASSAGTDRSHSPLFVTEGGTAELDGFVFELATATTPGRAGQPIDLRFAAKRLEGGDVPLEPVMGAYAHLVAFDAARSGFAHLHPVEADFPQQPDRTRPVLNFKLTIPRAGNYVVWAQMNLGGQEKFVRFPLSVVE